jgi:calcium-dependent protein kinase
MEDEHVYLVAVECAMGRLADRLGHAGHSAACNRLSENKATGLMYQLFSAVQYMHDMCICHRDLKVDNLLLSSEGGSGSGAGAIEECTLKVTGFEFARKFKPSEILRGEVGTLAYMAPEVLAGAYSHQCDMWSCGVIMYRMLCGRLPVRGETARELRIEVQRGLGLHNFEHVFNTCGLSEDAQQLLKSLLKSTACFRPSAIEALGQAWLSACAVEQEQRLINHMKLSGKAMKETLSLKLGTDCDCWSQSTAGSGGDVLSPPDTDRSHGSYQARRPLQLNDNVLVAHNEDFSIGSLEMEGLDGGILSLKHSTSTGKTALLGRSPCRLDGRLPALVRL